MKCKESKLEKFLIEKNLKKIREKETIDRALYNVSDLACNSK